VNRTSNQHNKRIGVPVILLTLGLTLINACSSVPAIPDANTTSYSLTITTQPTDTPASLESRYNGQVISYHPDAGFAVVRTNTKPSSDPAIKAIEKNQDVFTAPVVTTNAVPLTPENTTRSANVWMGGWSAWSGGWSAWSGGWSAWSGGTNTVPALPPENNAPFGLIRLQQAHTSSRNLGSGIKVAVLDTGVDTTHPMFAGRLAPSAEWKDFVDNDSNPQEAGSPSDRAFGHGTGVAGIILQVAPRATILPIRVLNQSGSGNLDAVVQGVDWALQRGANVINLSLGSDNNQVSLENVLKLAASRGVYVVASAGNEAREDGVTFPGRMTHWEGMDGFLFGIGSMNNQDILSSFTNYSYDLFASGPGESIYSAFPGNRTAAFTGTSFAAPIYAGAIALGLKELPAGMDARAFKNYLINSNRSGNIWDENWASRGTYKLGNGRLNVENLIRNLPGFTPKVAYGSTNFVKNGGFETGSTSNWGVYSGPVSVLTGSASSGTFALRLTPGNGVNQFITGLQPNTSYTLSAMIRNSTNDSGGATIGVYDFGGQESTIEVRGTTYTRRFVTFTTGPSNTSAVIVLSNWSGNSATAFFDDVTVHQTGY
jgi:hypothetical protein